jgi:hypothetical protein
MNKYILPSNYGGISIFKTCWAKSDKEASKKLEVSVYMIINYAYKLNIGNLFDGVMGYMDSGKIIFDLGRKDLMNKEVPIEELKNIIDYYKTPF